MAAAEVTDPMFTGSTASVTPGISSGQEVGDVTSRSVFATLYCIQAILTLVGNGFILFVLCRWDRWMFCMGGWMNGWMNGWMVGRWMFCMGGWMNRWMVDRWMFCMGGWMNGWMVGRWMFCMGGWMNRWMVDGLHGWMDEWMHGWIGGYFAWLNGCFARLAGCFIWMGLWIDGSVDVLHGWLDVFHGWACFWPMDLWMLCMDGRVDGWIGRCFAWMDGWIDGWLVLALTYIFSFLPATVYPVLYSSFCSGKTIEVSWYFTELGTHDRTAWTVFICFWSFHDVMNLNCEKRTTLKRGKSTRNNHNKNKQVAPSWNWCQFPIQTATEPLEGKHTHLLGFMLCGINLHF